MSILHITKEHTGKMEGMQSLSTCCQSNPNCEKFSKVEGSVCQKCYAMRMCKMYKNLAPCLEKNAKVLSEVILDKSELPQINASFFRFEAFGDLINETQVKNYFNICKLNEDTHFALWTKNPKLIQNVIDEGINKPSNLKIIVSSLFLNKVAEYDHMDFIDKVFTVFTKDYIDEHDIQINCGKKKCIDCRLCYKDNAVRYINEQVK